MAEESRPWPGTTVGDAGPYSDDDWDDIWEALYGSGLAPYNDRGVIRNWTNELEVTDGGANTADVDLGAALVHGKFYNHTAPVINLNIPSSSGPGNWREDLVCLQSDWTTQTIRIARHANPGENVGYPAPTQNDGVLWEIPLAAVRIDDVAAITQITDLRQYLFVTELQREIQKRPLLPTGSPAVYGATIHQFVILTTGEDCFFEVLVPPEFKELVEVIVYAATDFVTTFNWQCNTEWANCDELWDTHADAATGAAALGANWELECIDISAAFDAAPIVTGDLIGIRFRHVSTAPIDISVEVLMLAFRYR